MTVPFSIFQFVFEWFSFDKFSKSLWLLPTPIFHPIWGIGWLVQKKTLICVQCFDETYKFAYVLFQFSCGNIAISFHSIKLKVMDVSQKLRYKILKALDMWSSTVFMRIMWILRSASVIIVIWNFGIEFIQWDARASICKG